MSATCKVVVVGDGAVGKTCLLIVYTNNSFPTEYVPTVFDNYDTHTKYEDKVVKIGLWDTAGQEEYDRLRYLSYPNTDVFLVCYSVVNRISYDNVEAKWLPELKENCPNAPIVLVGTKIDLRTDEEYVAKMKKEGLGDPLQPADGEALKNKIKAAGFVECSAFKQTNVKEVFLEALRVKFANGGGVGTSTGNDKRKPSRGKGDKKTCMIL